VVEEIRMATTTVAAPSPDPGQPATIGPIGRIAGVFFNPKETFADIARHPSWIAPMIVLCLVWIGLNITLVKRVDWLEVTKQQIAKNKMVASQFENLKEEQKAAAYERGASRAKTTRYVRAIIGWPCLILITAAIYLGLYKLIGGARTNFATAFAISAFAHLPDGLRELLGIPVALLRDPAAIDPDNFLASNPAAFLGADAPLWQLTLLGPLDIFSIWSLVLVAIGFSMADPKKLPFGKSFAIIGGFYMAMVLFFTTVFWVLF
jgi:hypothetical protein